MTILDTASLERFITENEIMAEIVHLEEETPTVAAAAEALGVRPEQIGKSLLFLADGKPCLVVANGMTRVDYKRLANHLEIGRKRLRLARAEQVLRLSGYEVGTVPPFGHLNPLPTLLEANVLHQSEIYAGGGSIDALMRLTTTELLRVTKADVVSLSQEAKD